MLRLLCTSNFPGLILLDLQVSLVQFGATLPIHIERLTWRILDDGGLPWHSCALEWNQQNAGYRLQFFKNSIMRTANTLGSNNGKKCRAPQNCFGQQASEIVLRHVLSHLLSGTLSVGQNRCANRLHYNTEDSTTTPRTVRKVLRNKWGISTNHPISAKLYNIRE